MVYNTPSGWVVEFANRRVEKELESLSDTMQASFASIVGMIHDYGLPALSENQVKHLQGKLWEMRLKGKDGIARAAYIVATGKRIVVVHCFIKKTQRTPQGAIELALQRAKEEGLI